MHGRIATARVRPGAADQVAEGWRSLLSVYADADAFRGMVSLHDQDADVAVTLTLWESAAAADAAVEPLRAASLAVFADLLLEPPSIATYDVLLDARGPIGSAPGGQVQDG